jgi:hypothetical protein
MPDDFASQVQRTMTRRGYANTPQLRALMDTPQDDGAAEARRIAEMNETPAGTPARIANLADRLRPVVHARLRAAKSTSGVLSTGTHSGLTLDN